MRQKQSMYNVYCAHFVTESQPLSKKMVCCVNRRSIDFGKHALNQHRLNYPAAEQFYALAA